MGRRGDPHDEDSPGLNRRAFARFAWLGAGCAVLVVVFVLAGRGAGALTLTEVGVTPRGGALAHPLWTFPVLALTVLAAGLRPVRLANNQKISLATVPSLVACLTLPLGFAVMATAVPVLASNLLLRRSPSNAAFNAGQGAAASLAAGLIGYPIGTGAEPILLALTASVAFTAVEIGFSSAGLAVLQGRPFGAIALETLRVSSAQSAALCAIGVTMAVFLVAAPWAMVLPLGCLPLVFRINRALESELTAREKLDAALHAQRQFLTDVSHHVGNPLSTIRTNLGLLAEARLNRFQTVAVGDATQEADRLTSLWRRIRILAETDEGRPLRLEQVDVGALLEEVTRAHKFEAGSREVGLRVAAESEAVTALADADLVRQAVASLVENALRYTPAGLDVVLSARGGREMVEIEVADPGPGIAADEVGRLFERFARGPMGGSGLGLAIVRSIAERHRGQVRVETEPGKGSRFILRLPAGRAVSAR